MTTGRDKDMHLREENHPHRPPHITARIVVPPMPEDPPAETEASGPDTPAPTAQGMLSRAFSWAARRRRPCQYLQFAGAALTLLAIGFLLLPKSWVEGNDPAPDTPKLTAPFAAPTADAWVAEVPIGAIGASRILIDGRTRRLGEPIPPFMLRWTGRDEQSRLVFVTPDGQVRTREVAR